MSRRIRWYNRLAAWLYDYVTSPLLDLASPVWEEEAEREIQAMYDDECADYAEKRRQAEAEGRLPF